MYWRRMQWQRSYTTTTPSEPVPFQHLRTDRFSSAWTPGRWICATVALRGGAAGWKGGGPKPPPPIASVEGNDATTIAARRA